MLNGCLFQYFFCLFLARA